MQNHPYKVGFCIGNGTSREFFDLRKLKGRGTIVGCNTIWKDFPPDVLVTIDAKPIAELESLPKENRPWKWIRYTEKKKLSLDGETTWKVNEIPSTRAWNSGIIACDYLARIERVSKIYMFGVDFYRIHPGMVRNDLYSTGLYKYRNFDKSYSSLSMAYPDVEFIRVGPIHPHDVDFFKMIKKHFEFIDFLEFEVRLEADRL